MEEILRLKKSNCKNCYKCIRHCPVKAIRFSAGQAHVVETECVLCGQCFAACPQNAKQISSDLEKVRVMLQSAPVYASVAPTFAAAYPGIGIDALREAMQQLGFRDAEETAIGATIVKTEYERILREEKPNVLLSSCCTSVNLLVRKHYPDTLFALAPVLTPLQAHCARIKRLHPEAKTVFIGPCIAKKYEVEEGGPVDAALSFDELLTLLQERNIPLEPKADRTPGGKTRLFPTTGGVLNSMERLPDYTYLAVDGIEACAAVLEEVRSGSLKRCFIELSACPGSCANGPLMGDKHLSAPARNTAHILRYAGKEDFAVEQPDKTLCATGFTSLCRADPTPSEAQIRDMLEKMGKTSPEDELNCGSCGYNTCREKAIAVIQGKAEKSMCLPYMMKKAEGYSDTVIATSPNGILVLNDEMEVQKINPEACRLLRVRAEKDVLGDSVARLMDPAAFQAVRRHPNLQENQRLYMPEYECYMDRTILYNREHHLFICLMHDVSEEMQQQEKKAEMQQQAAAIADGVAKKQLKIVQEIASLLGETAADTLVAIERLKETISDD